MTLEFQPTTPAVKTEPKRKDRFLDPESMYSQAEIDGEPNEISRESRTRHNLVHIRYALEFSASACDKGNQEQLKLFKSQLIRDHENGHK